MFSIFQLTRYQIRMVKLYTRIGILALFVIFITGNVITTFVMKRVIADREAYTLVDGFPVFKDREEYIRIVKNYQYNPGVKFTIYKTGEGENIWDITRLYKISIDTILAANPHLDSSFPDTGTELIIPHMEGVLMPFDNLGDVWAMADLLNYRKEIRGDHLPTFFRIFSRDDIRFVFFKDAKPKIYNTKIKRTYNLITIFQAPLKGRITSHFGNRIDPFNRGVLFHEGVDIQGRYGTPIRPVREGMIIFSGWRDGLGKMIIIQHPDGYTSFYGHCSSLVVKKGYWVNKNDDIARVGSTGMSTGPHLHFELMRHGKKIDPSDLMLTLFKQK